jgi:hypothetical protein
MTTDMSGGPGAFRRLMNKVATWSIDSKRADENTTVFSLTAAVRDGYFTFLSTCWLLDATLAEKSP